MNNSEFRWHYVIYKIVNVLTGQYYIGQHRTTNPNDSYMGSGAKLKQDYARYKYSGKNIREYFKKEILFDFNTFEEMNRKEIELINDKVLTDPKSYNICRGGSFQFAYPKGCIIIEYSGRKGSLREWSEWIGLSPEIIRNRFKKGMSMAEIIALPPRERDKIWFNDKGEGHTLNGWCDMTGLDYTRLSSRLRAGWTLDEALSKEKFCGNKHFYKGKMYTTPELEKITGISAETLLARMNTRGWSVEKAVETPLMPNSISIWEQKFEWNGGSYTIEELASMSGGIVFKWTIHDRIKAGWDINQIMTTPSEAVDTSWKKKRYDYHGKQLTIDEGAEIAGITPGGLKRRMIKFNMTFEQAVDASKKRNRGKLFFVHGVGKTIKQWSDESGLNQNLLFQRLTRQGMSMEEALAMGQPKPHAPYKKRN